MPMGETGMEARDIEAIEHEVPNSLFGGDDEHRAPALPQEVEEGNTEYKLKLVNPTADRLDHLITQMNWRLNEGSGECIYEIGYEDDGNAKGISPEELAASLATLRQMADSLHASVKVLREADGKEGRVAEVLVRLVAAGDFSEVRFAVIGNVDSGKSTLIGVLTKGKLDNGRGLARLNVFRHRHEVENGRTSSVSQQLIGFDAKGDIVNYKGGGLRDMSWQEIVADSSKLVTFIDLAGHERYIKTTVYGMTGMVPDYALVVVGANMGVLRMTKEHIGIALALKIPMVFVVTKIDMCPEHVLLQTMEDIHKILRSAGVRKFPHVVKGVEDVVQCVTNMTTPDTRIAPIFLVSNVTGGSLDLLRLFLNLVPVPKKRTSDDKAKPAEVHLDETFYVAGVGTVVAGTVVKGCVTAGQTLLLGPDPLGQFNPVQIKSCHNKRVAVKQVSVGQSGTFALKKVKRKEMRKGMILCDAALKPKSSIKFDAEVVVLHHPTTITLNYQPVVHCITVRQATKLVKMQRDLLRTGDRCIVTFEFLYRPEYLVLGSRMIFREGRTKGMGKVVRLYHQDGTETCLAPDVEDQVAHATAHVTAEQQAALTRSESGGDGGGGDVESAAAAALSCAAEAAKTTNHHHHHAQHQHHAGAAAGAQTLAHAGGAAGGKARAIAAGGAKSRR